MSQPEMEEADGDVSKYNWKCPICGVVHSNVIVTLRHEINKSGGKYGEEGELPRKGLWPIATDDEPDGETARDAVEDEFLESGNETLWASFLEGDSDLPELLTEHDAAAMDVLEIGASIRGEIRDLKVMTQETEEVLDKIIDRAGDIEIPDEPEVPSEESPETEDEPDISEEEEEEEDVQVGGYTRQDVLTAEEEEMEKMVERLDLADRVGGSPAPDIFMRVYEERVEADGVTPSEISEYLGVPDTAAIDILGGLHDMGLLDYDRDTDEYRWPY